MVECLDDSIVIERTVAAAIEVVVNDDDVLWSTFKLFELLFGGGRLG